jgi:molybdate transport repressor ModE-like protein
MSLELLRAVANGGSISEAARQHGLSQPAASKRLAALERTLAVSLLERSKTGSRLTPEGQVVADWAGRVLDTVQEMFSAVAAMQGHTAADLRLVSSMTVAEHLVPGWLSSLRNIRPGLHVGLRVMNSHDVQDLVLEQQADLGLIETTSWNSALASRTISRDRLAVVVPPSHPWADRRRPLTAEELAAARIIVREPGSGTRETLDRLLEPISRAEPLLELGSNTAVKEAVRAGAGPAVLSVLAVQQELASGQLVEVAVAGLDLSRPLTAVWPRGRPLSEPSLALLALADTAGT